MRQRAMPATRHVPAIIGPSLALPQPVAAPRCPDSYFQDAAVIAAPARSPTSNGGLRLSGGHGGQSSGGPVSRRSPLSAGVHIEPAKNPEAVVAFSQIAERAPANVVAHVSALDRPDARCGEARDLRAWCSGPERWTPPVNEFHQRRATARAGWPGRRA